MNFWEFLNGLTFWQWLGLIALGATVGASFDPVKMWRTKK